MNGITFTIQNPDSKPKTNAPVIYYDNPKASNLTFLLTQNLGIKQLSKGDTITIHFPASLLQSINKDNVLSKGWNIKTEMPDSSNQNQYGITLSPTTTIDFGKRELAISLHTLKGKSKTNGDVSLSATVQGANVPMVNHSLKLMVLGYPDQPNELDDNILFPSISLNDNQPEIKDYKHLFVSNAALQPPIANQVKLNLKYSENQLIEKWEANKKPFFNISFSYGNSANDLTDKEIAGADDYNALTTAYNIVANAGEDDRWKILPETGTGTTVWQIVPTSSNIHLFTRENNNLDITLGHIISRLPEGNATIYIQWGNIPGYNDGWKARNIIKQYPTPRITAFHGPSDDKAYSIRYGDAIELGWEVFAAPKVQLRCVENPTFNHFFASPKKGVTPALIYCGGIASKTPSTKGSCGSLAVKSIVPTDPVSNFYLSPVDEEGKSIGDEVGPVTVTINKKTYPLPAFKKGTLKVKEAITPFTTTTTEPTFYISLANTTFTLQWQLKNTNVVEDISIIGPAGKTVKTINDPTQTQVSIPYWQDGAYQITLNSKESAHSITARFIVNQLFPSEKSFTALIQAEIPFNADLKGVFFMDSNKKIKLEFREAIDLNYQINLHFQQNKLGALSLSLISNQLTTASFSLLMQVPTSKPISVKELEESTIHVSGKAGFPQPSIQLSKLVSHSFTWDMHTDGNIAIQFRENSFSKEKWTIQLLTGSTPGSLAYQFTMGGNSSKMEWSIPLNNPPQKDILANVSLSGKGISAKGQVSFVILPPVSELPIEIRTSSFRLE